ncbi:MAG: T9SS type A sorting domain-containing protein [Flavobacteriales bacterium]|nr:T9SS type A sorting domain-containing protein [Flavobacteriales bacterium]
MLALLVDPSGKIFCGGIFTTYDGQPRHLVAKLNSNGLVSNSFTTGSGFAGTALSVSSLCFGRTSGTLDGGVICGGTFNNYRGQAAKSLCKMNSSGETSTNWYGGQIQLGPMGSTGVSVITEVPGGNGYYIGGNFTTPANRICKLDLGGNLVGSFGSTGYDGQVLSIVPFSSGSGSIICGGGFQNYASTPSNRIARLSTTGLYDASFISGSGFNGPTVLAKAISGKVYCAGSFTSYNGVARTGVARINTAVAAMILGNTAAETLSTDYSTNSRMTIWPNPNEGMSITLSLSDLDPRIEQAGITLFDAFGKLVHHEVIALAAGNARTELNLEKTLTAGIYLVSVTTGDEQRTERLVVQ